MPVQTAKRTGARLQTMCLLMRCDSVGNNADRTTGPMQLMIYRAYALHSEFGVFLWHASYREEDTKSDRDSHATHRYPKKFEHPWARTPTDATSTEDDDLSLLSEA